MSDLVPVFHQSDTLWTRRELATMAMALEEFRNESGPGLRELAERVDAILRGPRERFAIVPVGEPTVPLPSDATCQEGMCYAESLIAACDHWKGETERLREALVTAQGEAYLGTLAGDDTPDPLAACHNVIRACRDALAGWTA